MTGWIALVLIVAVVIATAAIFAAGRKAGVTAQAAKTREAELKSQKEVSDAKYPSGEARGLCGLRLLGGVYAAAAAAAGFQFHGSSASRVWTG